MGAAHPLATKSIQPKYTHLRDKGLPSKTKTWSATTIKEMVYSQKSHESLYTLTPNEIAGLCRTIKEYGTANDPLNRKRLRAFVRQQLLPAAATERPKSEGGNAYRPCNQDHSTNSWL